MCLHSPHIVSQFDDVAHLRAMRSNRKQPRQLTGLIQVASSSLFSSAIVWLLIEAEYILSY